MYEYVSIFVYKFVINLINYKIVPLIVNVTYQQQKNRKPNNYSNTITLFDITTDTN